MSKIIGFKLKLFWPILMSRVPHPMFRIVSLTLILLFVVSSVFSIISYFHVGAKYNSPLIPDDVVLQVASPHMAYAAIACATSVIALPFFLKRKYYYAIAVCVVGGIVMIAQ